MVQDLTEAPIWISRVLLQIWDDCNWMMTTAEIPDPLAEKPTSKGRDKPWLQSFGKLRSLPEETARINAIIEKEFERIETEELCVDPGGLRGVTDVRNVPG